MKLTPSFLALLLFTVSDSNAQEGIVICHKETVHGEVRLDLEKNIATVKAGLAYRHLHAREVKELILFEGKEKKTYRSFPFGLNSNWLFFEVLSDGKVGLLYRPGLTLSQYDTEEFPPFFMLVGESVYSLEEKRQVVDVMEKTDPSIKDFIRQSRVDFHERQSLKQLFDHFNRSELASR